jgi:hypothetical protein
MTLSNAIDRALRTWREAGIALLPPASYAAVRKTFADLGCDTSADVLSLYATSGGFRDDCHDSHVWSLWSLDRIRRENENRNRPDPAFADFLICSHVYRFRYETPEVSSIWMDPGPESRRVASSLAEFLELYQSQPGLLDLLLA